MKIQDQLRELEAVAEKKHIRVSYEALGGELGAGGLCKVRGAYRVIIDKRASPGERLIVLARALSQFALDDIYLAPELREVIEQAARFRRAPAGAAIETDASLPAALEAELPLPPDKEPSK